MPGKELRFGDVRTRGRVHFFVSEAAVYFAAQHQHWGLHALWSRQIEEHPVESGTLAFLLKTVGMARHVGLASAWRKEVFMGAFGSAEAAQRFTGEHRLRREPRMSPHEAKHDAGGAPRGKRRQQHSRRCVV